MRERILLGVGSLMVAVHFVDEVLYSYGRPGGAYTIGQDLVLVVVLAALWFFWPVANPWVRGGLALLLGIFAAGGNSFYHWLPVLQGRPNDGFYTSLISTPGALLIAAAGVISLGRSLRTRPS